MNLFSPSSYNFPYVYLRLKKTYFIFHAFVKTDGSHVEAKICEIFINRYTLWILQSKFTGLKKIAITEYYLYRNVLLYMN